MGWHKESNKQKSSKDAVAICQKEGEESLKDEERDPGGENTSN